MAGVAVAVRSASRRRAVRGGGAFGLPRVVAPRRCGDQRGPKVDDGLRASGVVYAVSGGGAGTGLETTYGQRAIGRPETSVIIRLRSMTVDRGT